MNTNLPEIKKISFFSKIKNWFKKIFQGRENQEKTDSDIAKYEQEIKKEFKNNIQVKNDKALTLMKKFETNKIDLSELTEIELDELIVLYKEKIKEKKEKIKNYKARFVRNGGI